MGQGTVVAVLDVGSNSVLLLTAEVDAGGGLRVVDDALATTRLGEGLVDGGRLDPAARERTTRAVCELAARARAAGATHVWGLATAAARRAADGVAYVAALARQAGCSMEVVTGEHEARLAYAASVDGLGLGGRVLAVDVGGGTTELTLGDGAVVTGSVSLPIGALRATERHVAADPPGSAAAAELRTAVRRALAMTSLPAQAAGAMLIASGGTATALAALDLGLPRWDPGRVHGHAIATSRLGPLVDYLVATPSAALAERAALDEGRARILPAGALILDEVVGAAHAEVLRVSAHGVRHAYLRERLSALGIAGAVRAS